MSDIFFEHFDPELELGNLDENGRPIRPRKKPGRKPNPPSPAQRKAQNRAAQRAFRERKRREMREAETTVKQCMYARDQALRESRRLKRRLDELQFETNYLKGYALTLKMACIANNVDVPKFWNTGGTDELGADELTFSKTKGMPQQMEFFLDKNMNIISIDQQRQQHKGESNAMNDNDLPPSSILSCSSPTTSYLVNDEQQHGSPLSSSPESSYASDFGNEFDSSASHTSEDLDIDNVLSSIAPQLANHMETAFIQQLLNTDLMGAHHLSSSTGHISTKDQSSNIFTTSTNTNSNTAGSVSSQEQLAEEEEEEVMIDSKTGLPRTTTQCLPKPDDAINRASTSSDNKKAFPPMTPLDALDQMRATKNLDANTRALFTPTELQRTIRHDSRIDVIPGAALRDHMILFQDFYDANELFKYLSESSLFLGGDLGNPDSWFVPPSFFRRYWFLCANHKRDRMDNIVDILAGLGKHMIELMGERKKMYIEREHYASFFPEATKEEVQHVVDNVFLQKDDQQHLDDIYLQQQEHYAMDEDEHKFMDDSSMVNNLPLDHFMTMINSANLPRMTPHQQFTA